jgi:excisionase family DNA binding protein
VSVIELPELMLTGEVAAVFKVNPKTVTRWAKAGDLISIRTLGGHRRFVRFQVEALKTGRPLTSDETTMLAWLTRGQP